MKYNTPQEILVGFMKLKAHFFKKQGLTYDYFTEEDKFAILKWSDTAAASSLMGLEPENYIGFTNCVFCILYREKGYCNNECEYKANRGASCTLNDEFETFIIQFNNLPEQKRKKFKLLQTLFLEKYRRQ